LPESFATELRNALAAAIDCAEAADTADELGVRQAVTALYHASSAVLLAWEGCLIGQRRGDARRALWARLVLDHRLFPSGPLARVDRNREAGIAAALLGTAPLSLQAVAPLLARAN
jgi:acyl-CoA dehydrogenase